MRRSWPIILLGLALGGSLVWGYNQSRARSQLALRTENQYHQSLYRLQGLTTDLETSLGTLQLVQSPALAVRELQNLRVFANGAIENLAALPLYTVAMDRTQQFLNSVRDLSEEYTFQLEHGEPLSDTQREGLRELHGQARFLEGELATLASTFATQRIRWADTERVTQLSQDGTGNTPILQGFRGLEARFQPPPGEEREEAAGPLPGPMRKPKGDLGPVITPDEAQTQAVRFVDIPPAAPPTPAGKLEGHFPLHLVSMTKANGVPVTLGISEQGGHVVWLLDGRPVPAATLGRDQLIQQARSLMAKNGLGELQPYLYDEYGDGQNVAVVTLVPVRDGIAYFHEKVKVRLAMDNGELLGYDAMEYYVNNHARQLPAPKLQPEEAAAHLAPMVSVEGQPRLGVIDHFRGQEVLVYEVRTRIEDEAFQVYVDALTGEEVRVLHQQGQV